MLHLIGLIIVVLAILWLAGHALSWAGMALMAAANRPTPKTPETAPTPTPEAPKPLDWSHWLFIGVCVIFVALLMFAKK